MNAQRGQKVFDTQRACYRHWRRIFRDNGIAALRWMTPEVRQVWTRLIEEEDSEDPLRDRQDVVAYCQRMGFHCSPLQTASRSTLARFQERSRNARLSQR